MKQLWHQHEPKRFSQAAFEKLKNRQEIKTPKEDETYRDPNYPNEFFTWHPFTAEEKKKPGNEGVAGEWRMGYAEVR